MRVPPRRSRRRFIIVALIVLFFIAGASSARFYTDVLWFQEVHLEAVLLKSLSTQFLVGVAVALLVGIVVWVNLFLAARMAPAYRLPRPEAFSGRPDPVERYRELIAPYIRWVRIAVAAFAGLSAGIGASASWQDYLLWVNRVPFGVKDPQFGRDVGFYVFELPFLHDLTDWVWFAFMAALLFSAGAHYFHGSLRPEIGLRGVSPAVLAHLSVLLGCLALVKGTQYYLGTFELNFSPRGVVTGASYTDVNAQLPALRLLMVISVVSAVLFLVNIRFRRLSLPIAAVGIWIFFAVVAGAIWPAAVQNFSVEPQELDRERPFIERNLEATRAAFGLEEVAQEPFLASDTLTGEEVQANEGILQNIRVWDPPILQAAYRQLQAIRPYYVFEDVDVDRYVIDGRMRQVLLSARELSIEDLQSPNWINEHLQYTHGFGLVASLANSTTAAGAPDFLVQDIPGTADPGATATLEPEEPRLYFGESFEPDEYSVVNTGQDELDYESDEEGVVRSNYQGEGGIPLGNFFRRIAFAIRELDRNLVLSGVIDSESRIMLYRDVRDRVRRAAPFLSLDHDPYPAVVDGRVVWILDAYTSSANYPYSQRFDMGRIVGSEEAAVLAGDVNYIRNSVKVVVDAYNGTMDFYIVDEDPLIEAWRKAFPDLFTTEEPSEDLRAHFRYPEDLFKVQSEVWLSYHIEGAENFYSKADEWAIARNVAGTEGVGEREATVPPTFLLIGLPGETGEEFVLTRPFTPRARNNMIALMVARSDPENYGELLTLQFPRERQVPGPLQVDNVINQDVDISQTLTLLQQRGSGVDFGSLVILPIEDSILYVQPLFVTAEDEGIPELKRVVLVFGQEVVMEETFDEALASLFGLVAEEPTEPGEPTEPEEPAPGEPDEPGGPAVEEDVAQLVEQAGNLYRRAQSALQDGDFETYARLITRLGEILEQLEDLSSEAAAAGGAGTGGGGGNGGGGNEGG